MSGVLHFLMFTGRLFHKVAAAFLKHLIPSFHVLLVRLIMLQTQTVETLSADTVRQVPLSTGSPLKWLKSVHQNLGFVVRGESPGCRLISTASMLEWLRNLLPHHSQGSSTGRWSRNTPRVVTARVFYILRIFFNVTLYFK